MSGKKRSYRIYILNLFTLLLVVTVVFVGMNFYLRYATSVRQLSERIADEVSQKIITNIQGFIKPVELHVQSTVHLIEDGGNQDIVDNRTDLWRHLWNQVSFTPYLLSLYVADQQGNFVQSTRKPEPVTRFINRKSGKAVEQWFYRNNDYRIIRSTENITQYDPRVRPWFKDIGKQETLYWTDVYVFARTKQLGITVSYPVPTANGKAVSSIVAADITLDSLSDFLRHQRITQNATVFIANENDDIVAFPDPTKTYLIDPNTEKARSPKVSELGLAQVADAYNLYKATRAKQIESETEGENYVSVFTELALSGQKTWTIGVVFPESDLLGDVYGAMIQTFIISGVILLISILIVAFISYRFSQPILSLVTETEHIKHFELDKVKGVESSFAEIMTLNDSIVGMTSGLQAFRKYVPSDLVRQLIQSGKEATPGGEKRQLTIFFSDIEGFTTISEQTPAEQLMLELSEYLDELTDVIKVYKGTIDKFIGDAIMCFWGAPLPQENAAYLACKAANDCQKRLTLLNKKREGQGKTPFHTRIGIHTGEMIVGNLGSEERLNYTAIGDNVNLGSRLEGINKYYGTRVIISHDTYQQVSDQFVFRLLDIVAVKGKTKGTRIYELVSTVEEVVPKRKSELIKWYHQAFRQYLKQDWDTAIKIFSSLNKSYPEDKAVAMLLQRTRYFKRGRRESDRVPKDWDGTFVLDMK